jgi:hypothetical protein
MALFLLLVVFIVWAAMRRELGIYAGLAGIPFNQGGASGSW